MLNTPSGITKYLHKLLNSNTETKLLSVKYTIEITIFK